MKNVQKHAKKILVIRFSSFGDIIQSMSVVSAIKNQLPNIEIHWATKKEYFGLLSLDSDINRIWSFNKKEGMFGLIKFAWSLRKEKYDFIYDAHSNLRSLVIKQIIAPFWERFANRLMVRSKKRWKRFLFFKFRFQVFPKPFRGMLSYLNPLKKIGVEIPEQLLGNWSFPEEFSTKIRKLTNDRDLRDYICLAPSAAWEMKRWPFNYWKELIALNQEIPFIILGGPTDHFCAELEQQDPTRVINLAGNLSLEESCYVVKKTKCLISADTGLIHAADILGKKAIGLYGPTAFGFPTNKSIKVLVSSLQCQPCSKDGRGKCQNSIFQKCMMDLTPELVTEQLREFI